ncbi:hypothetical protein SKAU_G00286190 [Synaphobranchus kaupii]|uniref:Uncharacterized protein n=1 Tax=Synaphobranchus kaupii TaxID=118154 RepID=A0A9Q1EYA0_SYNKA|nr:hypothetical protein SKAU_G00286190 [Synaphobranchus kaupii]
MTYGPLLWTIAEAGQRVQPNLDQYSVASIIRTFRIENRTEALPNAGGRRNVFIPEQENEMVNMVRANNAIRLRAL